MDYLKAEQLGTAKWRVLAIPFGGPLKGGKDLDYEYFSAKTDIKPDWFPERPVLWHHGRDPEVGDDQIGRESDLTKSKDGWWGKLWLERQNKYFAQIEAMMTAGRMFASSATMPHLVRKASDGELLTWAHIESTLSPLPRNPTAVVRLQKAYDDFNSAGIELDPSFKAILSDLDALTTDLESDLSKDGGDPAMAKLSATLDELDAVIRVT